jgi:hypothetical protein
LTLFPKRLDGAGSRSGMDLLGDSRSHDRLSVLVRLPDGGTAPSGFLPCNELRAQSDATPDDLVMGLRGVIRMLSEVLDATPEDETASDGVFALTPSEWRARAVLRATK